MVNTFEEKGNNDGVTENNRETKNKYFVCVYGEQSNQFGATPTHCKNLRLLNSKDGRVGCSCQVDLWTIARAEAHDNVLCSCRVGCFFMLTQILS